MNEPGYHSGMPVTMWGFDPITRKPVPINAFKNAINVHHADVHNAMVNQYLRQLTAVTTTVSAVSAVNDTEIEVASATGFVVNDFIYIDATNKELTMPRILGIVGNVLSLDRRLDKAHFIGDSVTKAIIDIAATGQDGSMAAPQEYIVGPDPGEVWHINRLLMSMVHTAEGDLSLFGDLPELTNGILLRTKINGTYSTLTNWRSAADMKLDMFDVEFSTRTAGGGGGGGPGGGTTTYGTSARDAFSELGVVIRLDGDEGDKIEVYNQDDIQSLLFFGMKVQGHIEGL